MFFNAMLVPEFFYISSSARNYKIFLLYMKKQDTSGSYRIKHIILGLENLIKSPYLKIRISLQNALKIANKSLHFSPYPLC